MLLLSSTIDFNQLDVLMCGQTTILIIVTYIFINKTCNKFIFLYCKHCYINKIRSEI